MSDYQEMLPSDIFTRPRRVWKEKIAFRQFLDQSKDDFTPEELHETGKKIAEVLASSVRFNNDDLIERIKTDDDIDEFNETLGKIFDECDLCDIWVKF